MAKVTWTNIAEMRKTAEYKPNELQVIGKRNGST